MATPNGLDLGDWLSLIAGGVLSGIGGAMAWFRGEKKLIHARMEKLEGDMQGYTEGHRDHTTQLAVIESCQRNTERRLDELTEMGHAALEKLDSILLHHRRD